MWDTTWNRSGICMQGTRQESKSKESQNSVWNFKCCTISRQLETSKIWFKYLQKTQSTAKTATPISGLTGDSCIPRTLLIIVTPFYSGPINFGASLEQIYQCSSLALPLDLAILFPKTTSSYLVLDSEYLRPALRTKTLRILMRWSRQPFRLGWEQL